MGNKKNRSFTTESIKDSEMKENTADVASDNKPLDAVIDSPTSTLMDGEGELLKPIPLSDSPINKEGRIERDYTSGGVDGTQFQQEPVTQQQPSFFGGPAPVNPTTLPPPPTPQTQEPDKPSNFVAPAHPQQMAPDAPAQQFTQQPNPTYDNPVSAGLFTNSSDPAQIVADKQAEETADFILDLYKQFVPDVTHEAIKINEVEYKKLESTGSIAFGAYQKVRDQNKFNKQMLDEQSKTDAKRLRKHLVRLCQTENINVPPHVQLFLVLIAIVAGQFFLIKSIRDSNKDLRDSIIEKTKEAITVPSANADDNLPLTEAEVI